MDQGRYSKIYGIGICPGVIESLGTNPNYEQILDLLIKIRQTATQRFEIACEPAKKILHRVIAASDAEYHQKVDPLTKRFNQEREIISSTLFQTVETARMERQQIAQEAERVYQDTFHPFEEVVKNVDKDNLNLWNSVIKPLQVHYLQVEEAAREELQREVGRTWATLLPEGNDRIPAYMNQLEEAYNAFHSSCQPSWHVFQEADKKLEEVIKKTGCYRGKFK